MLYKNRCTGEGNKESAGKARKKLLACIVALFVITASTNVEAGVTAKKNPQGGIDYTVDAGGYNDTVGTGQSTPDNSSATVVEGAVLTVTDKNAISLHDKAAITIAGEISGVINKASGGGYRTGDNLVEANSFANIVITETGSITKTGIAGNAEAINVHGFGNTITNHGTIQTTGSAGIWFQDTTDDGVHKNTVDNYGSIIRVGKGSVIGTSRGDGIIFHNRSGAVVEGDLQFSKGDDELYFEAGSTVKGKIDGGGGANSLTLEGDGAAGVGLLSGGIEKFQTLNKTGKGTWELDGDIRDFQTTNVRDGVLRLHHGSDFITKTMTVSSGATLAGGGDFDVQTITLNGAISPDALQNTPGSGYSVGTMSFSGSGSMTLGGTFRYDYDVVAPDRTAPAPLPTPLPELNDRIFLGGQTVTINQGGTINMRTAYDEALHKNKQLETGWYLLVDSDGAHFQGLGGVSNPTLNSLWTLSVNGQGMTDSPRNDIEFEYGKNTTSTHLDQIWLKYAHNSLTMDWSGGNANWIYGTDIMQSLQTKNGTHATKFEDGDKVHISSASGAVTVTLGDGGAVQGHPVVSGLVVGQTSGSTLQNGDVTIAGKGRIEAKENSAVGEYIPGTGNGTLIPTGKLEKYGAGKLTLANESDNDKGNFFEKGVDIHGGEVHVKGANVLGAAADGTNASLAVTFKGAGDQKLFLDAYGEDSVVLPNSFKVEAGTATIGTSGNADLVLTTAPASTAAAAIVADAGTTLILQADGGDARGDMYLTGNGGRTGKDIAIGNGAGLVVQGNRDTYIQSGITNAATGGTLTKNGTGTLQIEADSVVELSTTVNGGAMRIAGGMRQYLANNDVLYETSSFEVKDGATVAGGGKVSALGGITISGNISPDSFAAKNHVQDDERFGWLTLESAGRIIFDAGFSMDFDASGVTEMPLTGGYPQAGDNQDLLIVSSTGGHSPMLMNVGDGTAKDYIHINVDDTSFAHTTHKGILVIKSNQSFVDSGGTIIRNEDIDNFLTATINGRKPDTFDEDSPRGGFEFVLRDDNGNDIAPNADSGNIWFVHDFNSLTMELDLDASPKADWGFDQDHLDSLQVGADGTTREHHFMNGDKVYMSYTRSGASAEVVLKNSDPERLVRVGASGLVVGMAADGTVTDGDITISGAGGITTDKDSAFGIYAERIADDPDEWLYATGTLEKHGKGTLTFTNTGGNNFKQGIELYDGMTAFNRADQLGDGGVGIKFAGVLSDGKLPGLRADEDVEIDNDLYIESGVAAELSAAAGVTFTYNGEINKNGGDGTASIVKTGAGILRLDPAAGDQPSLYDGDITVREGTLSVFANYENVKGFAVEDGAVLSGQGTIGSRISGGVIRSGGTLAPGGYRSPQNSVTPLTIDGGLSFEAGSNFDITISQYPASEKAVRDDGKYIPVSDWVKVQNGTVDIDAEANLNVDIDYRGGVLKPTDFNAQSSGHFTIIDASDGAVGDADAQFQLSLIQQLPRGVQMMQGWQDSLFQLWFEKGSGGFGEICDKPNRLEIGRNLDDITWADYGELGDLLDYLNDLDDLSACNALDELTGDIVVNTLGAGMKRPWRHAFNRFNSEPLSSRTADLCDPCAPVARIFKNNQGGSGLWAEMHGSHTNSRYDGNARGHKIDRYGVAIGYDHRIADIANVGFLFNYTDSRLKQDESRAKWDDYEIGIYGRTWVADLFEVRGYAGFSHQDYTIDRRVRLADSGRYSGFRDTYSSDVSGNSLAASVELTRLFLVNNCFGLRPVAAFDYEQAWMSGFREKGDSSTALEFEKSNYKQYMLRFGVHAQVELSDRIDFQARAQYVRQLNGDGYASTGVRFANAGVGAGQRWARIRGTEVGKNSVNLGAGLRFALNREKTRSLYVNYDADINRKQFSSSGEAGIMIRW